MNKRWLKIFLKIILLISLFCYFGSAASPQKPGAIKGNYNSIKSYITQFAATKMKENKITGLSLAFVDDQRIIWTLSLGYADTANKVPVTSNTLFRIGSISKLFTATAIMQLVEQGKIDLDKPLQTYIPEFSMKTRFPNSSPITIRSIMTHSSGLPCDYLPAYSHSYPYFTELLKDIKNEYVAYPPNYITAYSNLAVALLGVAVERVSGQKFNDYITGHIFKPMEMNNSSFELRDDMKPLLSKGYRNNKPAEDMNPGVLPYGSIYSNANEMSHFIQMALANGTYKEQQILKEATLEEMFTPQTNIPLDLDTQRTFGLNWVLYQNPYWGKVVWHNGGTYLFFSCLYILREPKLGVIILTNSANGLIPASQISNELVNKALEVKIGPPADYYGKKATLSIPEINLEPAEGSYATMLGMTKITKQGKNLFAKIQKYPQIKFELIPQPDQWFTLKPLLFGLFRIKVKDLENLRFCAAEVNGNKVVLMSNHGLRSVAGEKIDPNMNPLPAIWLKRCGKYLAADNNDFPLFREIEMKVYQGAIMASFINNDKNITQSFVLSPLSDNELLIRGLGRNMHETVQIIKVNGEERLSYEGLEFVKKK
jgi:CubicO group peptidase (beta-lactamase class C family)